LIGLLVQVMASQLCKIVCCCWIPEGGLARLRFLSLWAALCIKFEQLSEWIKQMQVKRARLMMDSPADPDSLLPVIACWEQNCRSLHELTQPESNQRWQQGSALWACTLQRKSYVQQDACNIMCDGQLTLSCGHWLPADTQ